MDPVRVRGLAIAPLGHHETANIESSFAVPAAVGEAMPEGDQGSASCRQDRLGRRQGPSGPAPT